jgi:SEFIR domain
MEATVRLRLGDLFDGPADLIALPCSTAGTITGFVARSLIHYSIPHPRVDMALGEVEILPFEGADDIAQYVAFAASVRRSSSSVEAIERIGVALGEFTQAQPSVRTVSAPLLGAGAGGIQSEKAVAALRKGFTSTADPRATLVIHVLHKDVYERLKGNRRVIQGKLKETVRVFISHTSKSEAAVEWVRALALYLIEQGVQARLDKFHLRRGMDLPQWMCNELALAQKVIVICDEIYKQKADGRMGGVGWETMIIQGDLAGLPPESTKYQVIVRADDISKGLPMYLQTKYAFHAPSTDETQSFRRELLTELLDLPIDPLMEARECSL